MKKDQLIFLLGGLAFGLLFGFGLAHTWYAAPAVGTGAAMTTSNSGMPSSSPPSSAMPPSNAQPQGQPAAPAQDGGAPMLARINELKRIVTDDPTNVAGWIQLGNMYYDIQQWSQATGFYEKAVELDPENPDVLTDLGVCYRGMKQYDKALDVFDRAHRADPNHYQSLFNIVIVAGFDLGQFDRAEEAMQALEAMNPQPPRLNELAQALEQQRAAAGGGAS